MRLIDGEKPVIMEVASHVAADTVKMFEDESGFKKTYERAFRQIFAPLTEHLP